MLKSATWMLTEFFGGPQNPPAETPASPWPRPAEINIQFYLRCPRPRSSDTSTSPA
jgi:hypothetical protein